MKKKIYRSFIVLSSLSILLVASILTIIFYNLHLDSEKESIKKHTKTIASFVEDFDKASLEEIVNKSLDIRITVIEEDGSIIYDTQKDLREMKNHLKRPEIQETLKNGEGEDLRHSDSFVKDTYYYSISLSDARIIRGSQKIDNIFSTFLTTFPIIILILILILLISTYFTSILSLQILSPINYLGDNIENLLIKNELDTLNIYDELLPFVRVLIAQSEKIKIQLEDISEKKDITKSIISNMKEGLIFVDNNRDIISINKMAIEILEGNEDFDYKSKSFITISRDTSLNIELNNVLASNNNFEKIIKIEDKYIYISISKVFSEEKSLGAIIIMLDYTEKHKDDLIRKEFSSNVSHELKTPLTSINGYAEMIASGITKEEDTRKFASIIRNEGLRLLELINSIIKLSKIEEENYKKEFEAVDLYKISIEVIEELNFIAKEKDIDLKIIGDKEEIKANSIMMKELIYNLVDNAIKYTNSGGRVTIEIRKNTKDVLIKIKDTGIGIEREEQKRIFERFFMVDRSRTKNKNSTGLGLSIVKHIVEYHGFTIDLKSELDKGSEFIIICKKYL